MHAFISREIRQRLAYEITETKNAKKDNVLLIGIRETAGMPSDGPHSGVEIEGHEKIEKDA